MHVRARVRVCAGDTTGPIPGHSLSRQSGAWKSQLLIGEAAIKELGAWEALAHRLAQIRPRACPAPRCPPRAHLPRHWSSLCPSSPLGGALPLRRLPALPARPGPPTASAPRVRLGSHLDVPGPLVGLVGHLLLHASQLLFQVGHLILVKLRQVIELLLQPLVPGRGTRCDSSPGPSPPFSPHDPFHSATHPACSALFQF